MEKKLLFAGMTLIIAGTIVGADAQCPIAATLYSKESRCYDADTLIVNTIKNPSSISWYNGGIADTTVYATTGFSDSLTIVTGTPAGATYPNFELFGMAIGPGGAIYVLDILNNQVLLFPANSIDANNGIVVAGGHGRGSAANQFNTPYGIYVDAGGNLYVDDSYNYRIQKFPPGSTGMTDGITVAGGNGFGSAANQFFSIAFSGDASGNLYIVDTYNGRVLKFPPGSTSSTNGVTVAGGNGKGPSAIQLVNPSGVFVDGRGNIYIADRGNNRIQEFPAGSIGVTNGVTIAGGNGPGPGANQLNNPYTVFVDGGGNTYVGDANNSRIQEFPPGSSGATNGVTIALWNGGPGAGNSGPVNGGNGSPGDGGSTGIGGTTNQFAGAPSLYVDAGGDLFLAENYENRVEEWKKQLAIDTTYTTSTPGTYTAVVASSDGCSSTTNPVIIQPPVKPAITIATTDTSVCSGDPVLFTTHMINGNTAPVCQWTVNGIPAGQVDSVFKDDSPATGDVISCILATTQACQHPVVSDNTLTMNVSPSPSVTASDDTIIAPGSSLHLDPSVTGTIVSFRWTPATGLDNPNVQNPVAAPPTTTTYQLNVVSDNGCAASGKMNILVYYTLHMPNAFTPNGDGKNDVFRIPPSTPQKISRFCVYNRNGNRLFMTTDSGTGWNGTFNDRPQPAGAYVWEIEYQDLLNSKNIKTTGIVLLIR